MTVGALTSQYLVKKAFDAQQNIASVAVCKALKQSTSTEAQHFDKPSELHMDADLEMTSKSVATSTLAKVVNPPPAESHFTASKGALASVTNFVEAPAREERVLKDTVSKLTLSGVCTVIDIPPAPLHQFDYDGIIQLSELLEKW